MQIAICFNRRRRGKLDNKNISLIQNLIFFKRILANENRSTWIPNTFRRIFNNMEKGEKIPPLCIHDIIPLCFTLILKMPEDAFKPVLNETSRMHLQFLSWTAHKQTHKQRGFGYCHYAFVHLPTAHSFSIPIPLQSPKLRANCRATILRNSKIEIRDTSLFLSLMF